MSIRSVHLEPNDKPDLRNIKEEIETEPGMAQELLQSVTKGKGQSNFKKGKVMSQKHITDNKPEETKQETGCREEDEKIARSALVSRQA